nr:hypothetical protein HK105_001038 [Polyrhizophydium stewartii]
MPTQKVVPTNPAAVAALAAVLARIDALEQQRTAQHAARLTADTDHLAAGVAAPQLEPAAAAPPAAPAPYRRINGFRPSATNEWDRMPAEVQHMILAAASPFTKFVNGLLLRAELNGLSKQQQLQAWQEAADADWQGDLALLPPRGYSTWFPNIRTRAFYSRLKAVCDREDLGCVAIRNGWTDMLDFGKPEQLAECAALEGDVELLRELLDVRKIVRPSKTLACYASHNGHLDCVQFLHKRMLDQRWSPTIGQYAAETGNLDLVVWLRKHRPKCVNSAATYRAAQGNHMHIVRWLVDNVCDVCDTQAIHFALVNNNLEMAEFLCIMFPGILDQHSPYRDPVASDIRVIEWLDARGLIKPRPLLKHIAGKGKIDVLDWACERFQVELQEGDLEDAWDHPHNAVLKQAYERGMPFTDLSAKEAVDYSNTEIMSWIISRDTSKQPLLVDATIQHGDDALLEWWRVRHGVIVGQQDLEAAIRAGDTKTFLSLLSKKSIAWDFDAALEAVVQADIPDRKQDVMSACIRREINSRAAQDNKPSEPFEAQAVDTLTRCGKLALVKELHARGFRFTASAMDSAARNGHLGVVKFLHSHGFGCTTDAMDGAIEDRHLNVARVLHANRTEGCTNKALWEAVTSRSASFVRFLLENRPECKLDVALDHAAKRCNPQVVSYLHEGIARGSCKCKCLHPAIFNENVPLTKMLVESGHAACDEAAQKAGARGNIEIVQMLVQMLDARQSRLVREAAVTAGRRQLVEWIDSNLQTSTGQ